MKLSRESSRETREKDLGLSGERSFDGFCRESSRILEGNLAEIERSFHAGPER